MHGPEMFAMMFWMPMGMLFCVLVLAGIIWLLARLLNNEKRPTMDPTPPFQGADRPYKQGYRPPQPSEIYQEGRGQDQYSPSAYEQPQAQYPQELPRQR